MQTATQTAAVIDGNNLASELIRQMTTVVSRLRSEHDLIPGLAVVLVGDDPASQVYVRNKARQTQAIGMNSMEYRLSAETTSAEVLALVQQLNEDPDVHGILVQLPLPTSMDETQIIETIKPEKDVDGFHVINAGRLLSGLDGALIPCTPQGCMLLAKQHLGNDLSGKHALVIGRSNIVGKPVALLLLQANCTVTVAHSRTPNLKRLCQMADIVIAAVGRAEMIQGEWIKSGATVIDVGINRIDTGDGKTRLVGDVQYEQAAQRASGITPVPGGVGPMTIACLLRNTLVASCQQHKVPVPDI